MTLVLVRHGESEWNAQGLFCGWVDVDLSQSAYVDAQRSSKLIKQYLIINNNNNNSNNIKYFDICYCSVLKRSIKTANCILEDLNELYIPMKKSWRLNERFYGDLTGKSKIKMVTKYGKNQIKKWRRSYNDPPPSIQKINPLNPINDKKYYKLKDFDVNNDFPETESLYHVIQRIKPLWYNDILPLLKKQLKVLLCIHGTSMRAIISLIEKKYQQNNITFDVLSQLEIPNGYPCVYKFNNNGNILITNNDIEWIQRQQTFIKIAKINGKFLGNLDDLVKAQTAVKNQIEKNPTNSLI